LRARSFLELDRAGPRYYPLPNSPDICRREDNGLRRHLVRKWLSVLAIAVLGLALVIGIACGGGGGGDDEDGEIGKAQSGDTVKVHYTGTLEDGTVFDSSIDHEPLEFTIGDGRLIPGFEDAVVGMSQGESKTVEIPADEAYGPYYEELVLVVDRDQLPPDLQPEVGQQLQSQQEDGKIVIFTVIDISESTVTFDANHPLAGEDLTFDIQLVEIL
jgi:peptidylprolyl isomerase